MRFLRQALAALATVLAFHANAAAPEQAAALYSFADLYRLTVAGSVLPEAAALPTTLPAALPAAPAAADPALRPVSGGGALAAAQPATFIFSISSLPDPERWLLVLSGLALAAWLARRRLGYSFHT